MCLALIGVPGVPAAAQTASQQTYLNALLDFERYGESIWHEATNSAQPPDSGYWGDGGSSGNGGIRGNGGVAVAYAVLVLALPNDPKNPTRLAHIRQALNYNANTHVTGSYVCVDGHQWGWSSGTLATCTSQSGSDWQSAEWTGSMGLACVLAQSNLPAQTVLDVQRVTASEADHRAGIPPCTRPLSSGDTKAEENAWDGNVLSLAAAWMGTNSNSSNWLYAAEAYLANTYTVANTNGDPLANWITTVTLFPSYALENHGFYHPTYEMVAGMSSGDSLLMARLCDTNVAAQLRPFAEHNVMTVWSTNLYYMLLDSGEFAYPSGLDWELHDYEQNSYVAWIAAHFNDPIARWADGQLAQLVRYRQIVNGDGSFIGPSGGGFYREAVEARRTAIAWLQWQYADYTTGPTNAPAPAVVTFPDVGVIAQRSANGFFSVSYGTEIMSMMEAAAASVPTNPFVATPALPGGMGNGPLGNATAASLASFTTNASGFTAQFLLQNGSSGSTKVYVASCGDAAAIVEVPLPASGSVHGTSAGCFTNGIENDPLTGGSRLLEWTNSSLAVTNFANKSWSVTNKWICVAGRYGFSAGPGGHFVYQAAASYNRLGAAQDYLTWIPAALLSARYAVWFPNKSASQVASLTSQISWTTNGSTVLLTFPTGGSNATISASLSSGNGMWNSDSSGLWSDPTKWSGGNVADGVGSTANFSTVNITADRTVTLDSSRAIGTLEFGDPTGGNDWFLTANGGSQLTLSAGAPAFVVNQNTVTISAPLTGSAGFTKSGPGTLVLSGTNSISGTWNLDSGSTTANDGGVRITTSAAVAGASALLIRNNTGVNAASTLQLDGTSGSVIVTQDFTMSCRANTIATIENLAGSNTLSGNLLMQTGGSNVVIQCDAGTLALTGTLQYIGTLTAARAWNFIGAGNTLVTAPVLAAGNGAPVSIGQFGPGTLLLRGANSFGNALNLLGGTVNFQSLDNLGAAALFFSGGTLQYAPGNTDDISSRTVTFGAGGGAIDTETNDVVLTGSIGGGGAGGFTKLGTGTLTFSADAAYSGTTTISNGTLAVNATIPGNVLVAGGSLAGVGTIGGNVTILPAGTVSPGGAGPGALTIAGSLTNLGTIAMRLNKSGTALTNNVIQGPQLVSYGGTLQLSMTGDVPAVGDTYHLFYATNFSGAFAAVNPATPGAGLAWNTNNLPVDGTLTVVSGVAEPDVTDISVSGSDVIMSGTGGMAGGGYSVLSFSNLSAPLSNWSLVATGMFDTDGSFSFTNSGGAGGAMSFYRIRVP